MAENPQVSICGNMKQSGKDVCDHLKRYFCFSFNINYNLIQFNNHSWCLVGPLQCYLSLFLRSYC